MEKKKVLVVDDEEDFLKVTKLNLEKTDKYEVKVLSSAKSIISEVHAFSPDVILLDLLLPAIGGIEACEMLNQDPQSKNIPIIIVSAIGKEGDKRKAYMMGVSDYLVKPIEKNALIAKIEKVLQFKQ